MMGALSHLRVLDLSRVLAGPWAGQILADLGAEVIKVERPGRGDDTRGWAPPYMPGADGEATTESAYFSAANRGKKSITVDITQADGQALIRRLAAQSDLVLENFKVGNLAKYGLDYVSLKAEHPELIYCSITGFGQDGPYRDRPGYDFMIQALSGLMSITGERDDRPGGGPQKVGVAMSDILTGMYATVAVLAALAYREQTGRGQYIDLALLDVQIACLANQAMNYLASGVAPERLGNAHPNIVPYQAFASADGYLIVAVGNNDQFGRLACLLERSEWSDDPRFATNAARVAHRDELVALLEPLFAGRETDAWLTALEAAGIPCGPINTLDRVFADPQVRHRGARIELAHPTAGTVPLVANPLKFSESPVEYRSAPPLLGQHTDAVLGEVLGMSADELADLRARGVV